MNQLEYERMLQARRAKNRKIVLDVIASELQRQEVYADTNFTDTDITDPEQSQAAYLIDGHVDWRVMAREIVKALES